MGKFALGALFVCAALPAACSGPASHPLPQTALSAQSSQSSGGKFVEYPLPAGADPQVFTKGPYGTLWFAQNNGNYGNGFYLYRFTEKSGAVGTFSMGEPWSDVSSVFTANGAMYFLALNVDGPGQNPEYLANANSSGTITIGMQMGSDEQFGTLVQGPDGNLWFPDCLEACTEYPSGNYVRSITTSGQSGVYVQLPDFNANQLTPGPLGYMYVSASYTPGLPPPPKNDSAVFVLSTKGTIVHKFLLPYHSAPNGIAPGPDHNLWIAEPGVDKIARMTPSGAITQFKIPTPNAQAAWITGGADGALWFTESSGNKIGRITTSGSIREFSIPTANAVPTYITYCYPGCGTHYGVWFSETAADKIARFDAPI